jgi:phosphatidylglycerophosphate synthase
VVLAAALSDLLDGFTSRLLTASSKVGQVLDPVADKVFVLMVVTTLWGEGLLHGWEIGLVGMRDWDVLIGSGWLFGRGQRSALRQLSPSLLGKITTTMQFLWLLSLLAEPQLGRSLFPIAAVCSSLAATHYAWLFLNTKIWNRCSDNPRC